MKRKKKSHKKTGRRKIARDISFFSIYIISIVLIIVVFFTWTYHNRQFNAATGVPNETIASTNDSEVKKVEKVLPNPTSRDWVEYEAKCTELRDYIKISYPKGWEPAEWNHVSDDPEAIGECQVIFGFPLKPKSYQEHTPGDIAQMRVMTVDSPDSESIEAFVTESYGKDLKLRNVTVNGRDFVMFDLSPETTLYVTKSGTRFFTIQGVYGQTLYDIDPQGTTVSTFSRVITKRINDGFLNRLVFF